MDAPEARALQPDRVEAWEVYARHDREERAHYVGRVQAVGPKDARVFAYMLYDERRWQEMFVVRHADVVSLVAPG
jgi:hypothetical protein